MKEKTELSHGVYKTVVMVAESKPSAREGDNALDDGVEVEVLRSERRGVTDRG